MEIGGLTVYAFRIVLGNPDIMAALLTWAVLITLTLTIIETNQETKL